MTTIPATFAVGKNSDPPHNRVVCETRDIPNEHGVVIRYKVYSTRKYTMWWIGASYVDADGQTRYRASAGLGTRSESKARQWMEDVKAGNVAIARES